MIYSLKKENEINVNEERIQNIIKLRKRNLYQKIFIARQRKFPFPHLKTYPAENNENNDADDNNNYDNNDNSDRNKVNENELNLNDYLIDPDDLDINDIIKKLDFVDEKKCINNIILLLSDIKNVNSILYGLLMMRKFAVIDAVLINKSEIFIEKKLYIQICSLLFDYCHINTKIVFESLWILTSFVYDSDNKELYNFLISDKCLDLYKKIIISNSNNKYDLDVFLEEISTLILNLLIFKKKESENEDNIINSDYNEEYLMNFLIEFVDIILNNSNNKKEIYISLFIQITNCFTLEKLMSNYLLKKIITFLIEENIKKLNKEYNYYEEDINEFYDYYIHKSNIQNIHQISLLQLQYMLTHPLKDMLGIQFEKLSTEIIEKLNEYINDKNNNIFYVGYINCYISYILDMNIPLSFDQIKKLFDYLMTNIKNENNKKITKIMVECFEGLNNLSIKMSLNKMIGFLITELPNNILPLIKDDKHVSIKVINEILNLIITLLIDNKTKFYGVLETQVFTDVINCVKSYYDCKINNDVKDLYEKGYFIISRIIEVNIGDKKGNDYIFLFDKMGMKEITSNLAINPQVSIPYFILNILNT